MATPHQHTVAFDVEQPQRNSSSTPDGNYSWTYNHRPVAHDAKAQRRGHNSSTKADHIRATTSTTTTTRSTIITTESPSKHRRDLRSSHNWDEHDRENFRKMQRMRRVLRNSKNLRFKALYKPVEWQVLTIAFGMFAVVYIVIYFVAEHGDVVQGQR